MKESKIKFVCIVSYKNIDIFISTFKILIKINHQIITDFKQISSANIEKHGFPSRFISIKTLQPNEMWKHKVWTFFFISFSKAKIYHVKVYQKMKR